jgi:putative transcriptional regulator
MNKNSKNASGTKTGLDLLAAAFAGKDAQPLTKEPLGNKKTVPRVKLLRMRLRLTQEQFANRYGIPLTALRDWEQGHGEPDQAIESYIAAIEADLYRHYRSRS